MFRDKDALESCAQSCLELRDRLKVVVEAQAKEQQLTKKFDQIAVFDQADRRASELISIIRARIAWKEGVKAIESLDEGEPASENVVFSLQDAYNIFSKQVAVPERGEFLERVKDVFLSWYSTRVVLALQSDTPAESLLALKAKYDRLDRSDGQDLNLLASIYFNAVIRHYIKDQSKLELHEVATLPDLFVDLQRSILANYTRLREGKRWAEKVLTAPSEFIAEALTESVLAQWNDVEGICERALTSTNEEDSTGALSLRMILALKQLIADVSPQTDEDKPITECVLKIGNGLMEHVAAGYSKLASSYLTTYANISLGTGTTASSLEQLSNGLSQLIKESDYLMQIASETFDCLAIIYITPAFRSMYENLVSLLSNFYKATMDKTSMKNNDILRLISISGQLMLWLENDRRKLKDMLDSYRTADKKNSGNMLQSEKLAEEIANFEKRISVKAEGDLGIAKSRTDFRKLNKRFVTRAVEHLSRPFVSSMESALKEIRSQRSEKGDQSTAVQETSMPSFGSTPNEFVTSAGVSLLSLAHELSSYSHDTNMAYSLAVVSKTDSIEDVTSWWVEKCAATVQDCFIDGMGEIGHLPPNLIRQFAVDYVYLADVFEDLGTAKLAEFDEMRQTFADLGYIKDQS
ncbi:unnamed protein product [Anisakis simplex]|uniref:Conserved oligomeric Golgi complex subunit 7 n=1 Tax=Anisakis simplex TaxID=6269 RepID=A0A0M3KAK7_ANISI|nr:unnamed protein product [Anisakis simplex]